jgi:hypothetical protein
MSANSDEIQILVYDYFATLNTTGTDTVTVTLSYSQPATATLSRWPSGTTVPLWHFPRSRPASMDIRWMKRPASRLKQLLSSSEPTRF